MLKKITLALGQCRTERLSRGWRERKEWAGGSASLLQLRASVTESAEASASHGCMGRRRVL